MGIWPGQTSPGRQAVRQQLNDVASKELIMDKARGNKRRVHKAIKGKKGKTAGKCCEGVNMKNYYTSEHSSNNNGISLSKKKKKQKPPLRSSNLKPNTKPKANDAVNPVDCSTAQCPTYKWGLVHLRGRCATAGSS